MEISFSEKNFNEVFAIYRSVNRSHWKIPIFSEVKDVLDQNNIYEFTSGPKDNWTSKLVIIKDNNKLKVDFLVNENSLDKIKKEVLIMKQKFLNELNLKFKDGQ